MNRLQLATLLSWADDGGLRGRKRLQKVVFFLQDAGCPLECRFTLHHFGPYSSDVADACDEIVAAGLVDETGPANGDLQYTYTLKPKTRALLKETPDGAMNKFQPLGTELINKELWTLELGSTILLFHRQTSDWQHALDRACEFKKVSSTFEASEAALALAKRIGTLPKS